MSLRVFWDILTCSQIDVDVDFAQGLLIALMMAACTSETSVVIYLTTRQYIPEDSEAQLYITTYRPVLHFLVYSQVILECSDSQAPSRPL
jgi:hypothetical protein